MYFIMFYVQGCVRSVFHLTKSNIESDLSIKAHRTKEASWSESQKMSLAFSNIIAVIIRLGLQLYIIYTLYYNYILC